MRALEHSHYSLVVLLADANTVVDHRKLPGVVFNGAGHMDARSLAAVEFDGVVDQVLEQLHHVALIAVYMGQVIAGNERIVFLYLTLQVGYRLLRYRGAINRL